MNAEVTRDTLPYEVVQVLPGLGEFQLARFHAKRDAQRFARSMQRVNGAAGFRYYIAEVEA